MNTEKPRIKVVLDSNIIISALVFGGKPRIILEKIIFGKIEGIISTDILNELLGVLKDKFKYIPEELLKIKNLISNRFITIKTNYIPNIIKEDPDDNFVLAICHKADINCVVTGDRHLLDVREYKGIKIIKPDTFLKEYLNLI